MAGVFLDEGRKTVLDVLFNSGRTPRLRLFTNTFALVQGKVAADFSEPGFTGYAAIDLSTMAAATINGADQGEKDINPATFTVTTSGAEVLVAGYYITITDIGGTARVVFADKFPGLTSMKDAGNAISFPLTFLDELGS